ncbi:unnamed protein product, partial [Cyprideis torosa]
MASEIQKEPSALEVESMDEAVYLTKLDNSEVSIDSNDFSGSGETMPLPAVIPGSIDNTFKWQRSLRSHGFTHKKEKRFHCSVCGKGFRSKVLLVWLTQLVVEASDIMTPTKTEDIRDSQLEAIVDQRQSRKNRQLLRRSQRLRIQQAHPVL